MWGPEWGKVGDIGSPAHQGPVPAAGLFGTCQRGDLTGFLGSYRHQLDDKGRLALPAAFRRNAGDGGFVLLNGHDTSLFLYPARSWADVEKRLGELLQRQPGSRKSILALTANAMEVEPDKQGRILIPERLQKAARLEGEALIVGMLEKIEIWNPELFADTTAETNPEIERYLRQIFV